MTHVAFSCVGIASQATSPLELREGTQAVIATEVGVCMHVRACACMCVHACGINHLVVEYSHWKS